MLFDPFAVAQSRRFMEVNACSAAFCEQVSRRQLTMVQGVQDQRDTLLGTSPHQLR